MFSLTTSQRWFPTFSSKSCRQKVVCTDSRRKSADYRPLMTTPLSSWWKLQQLKYSCPLYSVLSAGSSYPLFEQQGQELEIKSTHVWRRDRESNRGHTGKRVFFVILCSLWSLLPPPKKKNNLGFLFFLDDAEADKTIEQKMNDQIRENVGTSTSRGPVFFRLRSLRRRCSSAFFSAWRWRTMGMIMKAQIRHIYNPPELTSF